MLDSIISIIPFIRKLFPEKNILCFEIQERKKGVYNWILENKTKNEVEIIKIEINGIDINEVPLLLNSKSFPIKLNPLGKISWQFELTNVNSSSIPKIVRITIKSFLKTKIITIPV